MTWIKRKRVIPLVILAAILMNLASFSGIYAYRIVKDQEINQFTVGHSKIEIEEDFTSPEELKPGITIPKDVKLRNTGKGPCMIRVFVDFSNRDMAKYAKIDFNTADWQAGADGYYYYPYPVEHGEATTSLFTQIKIAEDAPEALLTDFDVPVYAESKNAERTDSYQEVWGL